MEKFYTCEEIAKRYGVKTFTVWEWIRKKKLTAIRIGSQYRVRQSDIDAFEANAVTK